MSQNWTWSAEFDIASETGAGREVLDQVLGQLEGHGWTENDTFGIHLSVEEALVNAIRHGNRRCEEKRVQVRCRLNEGEFFIEITDEGPGFDPKDVPDPTLEENLERPSGRGLMLMRNFMTEVHYSEIGNQVTMIKRRDPPAE